MPDPVRGRHAAAAAVVDRGRLSLGRQLRVDYGCSTGRQNPEEAVTAAMLTPGQPRADDLLRACAARLYPSAVRMTGTNIYISGYLTRQ